MKNTWKPIQHLWEIDTHGNIRNILTKRPLKVRNRKDGYLDVKLSYKRFLVHRLVALSFINNPHDKKEVNHLDGIRSNCRVDNLEWVTPKENVRHAFNSGFYPTRIGENNSRATITERQALDIKLELSQGMGIASMSRKYGVSYYIVANIKYMKSWAHLKVK